MNMNAVCMMCRQTTDSTKKDKLLRMLSMCRQQIKEKPNPGTYHSNMQWTVNSHCKYGISCPKLKMYDRECKDLGRQLEPYLKVVAETGDARLYSNLLSLLRGDFPSEYRKLEEMRLRKSDTVSNDNP